MPRFYGDLEYDVEASTDFCPIPLINYDKERVLSSDRKGAIGTRHLLEKESPKGACLVLAPKPCTTSANIFDMETGLIRRD